MPVELYDRCVDSHCVAVSSSPLGDDSDAAAVVCDFLDSFSHLCVAGGEVNLTWRTDALCRQFSCCHGSSVCLSTARYHIVMIESWLVSDIVVITVYRVFVCISLLKLVEVFFSLFFAYLLPVLSFRWIKIITDSAGLRHTHCTSKCLRPMTSKGPTKDGCKIFFEHWLANQSIAERQISNSWTGNTAFFVFVVVYNCTHTFSLCCILLFLIRLQRMYKCLMFLYKNSRNNTITVKVTKETNTSAMRRRRRVTQVRDGGPAVIQYLGPSPTLI